MAGVITGAGLGVFGSSANVLGGAGVLGQSMQGRAGSGSRVYVNSVNGNLILQSPDSTLSGRGADLGLLRTYNLQGTIDSASNGLGWSWDGGDNYVAFMSGTLNVKDSVVRRITGDGHQTDYIFNGSAYVSTAGDGAHDTLVHSGSTWTWTDGSTRSKEVYGESLNSTTHGRLQSRTDASGNQVNFSYSGGLLTGIADVKSGLRYELKYSGTPQRLSQVNTFELNDAANAAIKQVSYTYYDDGSGRLKTVSSYLKPGDPASKVFVTTYAYEGASTRISSITQNDGSATGGATVGFTYEQVPGSGANGIPIQYRVTSVTDANGIQSFQYNADNTTKITVAGVGNTNPQSWIYTYDAQQQLVVVQSPDVNGATIKTNFYYDASGNLFKMIDARGIAVIYQYDLNGNLLTQRDSLGDTITRTYDSNNQLLTETRYTTPDAAGLDDNIIGKGSASGAMTSRFVYGQNSLLRFVISAEGRVMENRYTADGLLERTIQYAGGRYDVGPLAVDASPSEADMTSWVAQLTLDKKQIELSQFTYDFRGNLSRRIDFASADATGAGVLTDPGNVVTDFSYDGHGRLAQSIVRHGALLDKGTSTSYVHDGLGRLTSTVDAAGIKTTTTYDDLLGTITVKSGVDNATALHLTSISSFNALGQLTSVSQTDTDMTDAARVTRYVYNEQGRLQLTLDPQGGRHFSFFDPAGRLAFVVDSTGVVTGYTYDEDGHPLTETHYANRLKGIDGTHDANSVTAAWLDSTTNPTKVKIQTLVLGTDLIALPAQDRTLKFHYDLANRMDQRTDAGGTSDIIKYDGASRIERQTTGERVTRSFYDHDGLLVGVLDPLGNLVENKYNAAKQLVQTIRYGTRSPLAVDSSRPVWVGADGSNIIEKNAVGGKPFTFRIPLVDADGDSFDLTVVSKPSWATVTKDEGGVTITGTPPPATSLTTHEIKLTANDKRGSALSTADVTVRVKVDNAPPVWGALPDFTVTNKKSIDPTLQLPVASDAESPGSALQYSFAGLPAGITASFNATTNTLTLGGTPTLPGLYVVLATVKDPQGLTTQRSFSIQVADAGAPIVAPMSAQTATRTQAFNLVSLAPVDPDGQEAQFQYTVLEKPSWLSFTSSLSTLTFSGTPPATAAAVVQWVRIEVADPQYGSSIISFPITILNATPTGWPANFGEVRTTSATVDFTPPAATDPEGATLTYDAFNLTPGMSFDTTTGHITGTIANFGPGSTRTIQLQARDSENAAAVSQITFRFDQPPTYNGGMPGVIGHRALPITIPANTFTDADGDPLNVQASGLPPGVSFDGRTFSGIPTTLGNWTVTVTAIDPFGLSTSVTTLIFRDADPPPPPHNPPPSPFPGPRPPILPQFTLPLPGDSSALAQPTGPMQEPPAPELVAAAAAQPAAALSPPPLPVTTLTPVEDVLATARPATNDKDLRSFRFYDGVNRSTMLVDERGFVTENVFDEQLNQQRTLQYTKAVAVGATMTQNDIRTAAGAVARTTTLQFDDAGRVATRKDIAGTTEVSVTNYQYDSAGHLVRKVEAAGSSDERSSRTQYDAFNEVTAVLDGEADVALLAQHPSPTRTDIETAAAANGTRYVYNSLGQRIRSFGGGPDASGNDRIVLSYFDSEGRLAYSINALGEVTELLYNSFSELKTQRRYAKRLTKAQLTTLQIAGGGAITSALTGLLPALRDTKNDQTTLFEYDQRGMLTKQTDAADSSLGLVTTSTYDLYGQLKTQTHAINASRSATTRLDYDLDGRLVSTTGDLNGINFNNQTRFDAFGRSVMTIDAAGRITSRTDYLDSGRTIEVKDVFSLDAAGKEVSGHKVRTEYDFLGRTTKLTDATGKVTTYGYNDANRSMTVTTPEGVKIITVKTREGETLSLTHGTSVTTYGYDHDGRLLTVKRRIDGADKTITANEYYQTTGLLKSTKDARGTVTQFFYDAANRMFQRRVDPKDIDGDPTTSDNPSGLDLVCTYEFTAFGQEMRITEGHGDNKGANVTKVTKLVYDQGGRKTQVIVDPDGLAHTTSFAYDGLDNAITVSQGTLSSPNQLVTSYGFDNLGRRISETVAPGNGSSRDHNLTTFYRYDLAGNMTCKIDAAGNRTWFVYDKANRLTQTINSLGEVNESAYDANGRLTQSHVYRIRLAPSVVAAFGDVVGTQSPVIDAKDSRSYIVLDGDGRMRFTLTAQSGTTWSISENVFDGNGNVVERIDYDRTFDDTKDPFDATKPSPINTTLPVVSTGAVVAELASLYKNATTADLAKARHTHTAFDTANRARFTVDALGDVTEVTYDDAGNILRTMRFAKRPTLAKFDADTIGKAVDRNDVNNQATQYSYNTAGQLRFTARVLASNGSGVATQLLISERRYDDLNRVIETIDYATTYGTVADFRDATLAAKVNESSSFRSQDRRTINAYDTVGNQVLRLQVSQNNSAGQPTRYIATKLTFDNLDRLVQSTVFAREITTTLADDKAATISAAIVASDQDRSTTYVLDAVGRRHFVIASDNTFSENVLDALGRVIEQRQFAIVLTPRVPRTEAALMARRGGRVVGDGVTRGVKFSYDSASRVLTTTDALGFSDVNEYDGLGNRITFTDKAGSKWKYEYDRMGRLISQTSPETLIQLSTEAAPVSRSLITALTYDAFGNLKTKDEANGTVDHRLTVYGYDLLGRQTTVELALYDPNLHRVVNGQPVDGDGRFWRRLVTDFDALGNAVRTGVRTGTATFQYEYKTFDNLSRIVHDVDALNHVTKFVYTAFGDQQAVTRYSDQIDIGRPTAASGFWSTSEVEAKLVGDTASRTVTTQFDTMGRKTLVTQPQSTSYFYSKPTTFPVAGSVSQPPAAATRSYQYNAFGDLFHEVQAQTDTKSQEAWHYYDARGRETRTLQKLSDRNQAVQPHAYDTQRTYDEFGNVRQVIEYAGFALVDENNSLTPPPTPMQDALDRITGFTYDAQNQQKVVTRFGLKYTDENLFDVSKTRDQGTDVSTIDYDAMGHVTGVKDALMNVTRTQYDALGRVTTVTEPARLVKGAGSIDPFLGQANVSPVTSVTYNAYGQVVTTTRSSGGVSPAITTHQAFDAAGNLISSTDAMGTTTSFEVDYAGRMTRSTMHVHSVLAQRLPSSDIPPPLTWRTVDHDIDRRFAYDLLGRMTDALDIFKDDSGNVMQSGLRKKFNSFGDVTAEQKVWGSATTPLSGLSVGTVTAYGYDNAGQLTTMQDAGGLTRYYYNLAGQMTRKEETGNGISTDGTSTRVSEMVFDLMGRAIEFRRPTLSTSVPGATSIQWTPYSTLRLDRWGNAFEHDESSFNLNTGSSSLLRTIYSTYNADNNVTSESHGPMNTMASDGVVRFLETRHETHYDLLGRDVREVDIARDFFARTDSAPLREHSRVYDAAGNVTSETTGLGTDTAFVETTRYAFDANGNKVGELNNLGTVTVDDYDLNGNVVSHAILRAANRKDPYVSWSGQSAVAVLLNSRHFDSANRLIEEDEYNTNFFGETEFKARFTAYDERSFARATFTLWERDLDGTTQGLTSGVETSCTYDVIGNKTREEDAAHSVTTWQYDTTADPTTPGVAPSLLFGQLRSINVGGHVTDYFYNDFGQLKQEKYSGAGISDPTSPNQRLYSYNMNGLVSSIFNISTFGIVGASGGADYTTANSTTDYLYNNLGLVSKETIRTDGTYELETSPNIFQLKNLPILTRSTSTAYDTLGRIASVQLDSLSTGASQRSHGVVTYDYDALSNRRRITSSYTGVHVDPGATPQIDPASSKETWFEFDSEGRMTRANRIVQNGVQTDAGTIITYDLLGRRATARFEEGTKSCVVTTTTFQNATDPSTGVTGLASYPTFSTYSWGQTRSEFYSYNDQGLLTTVKQAVIQNNKTLLVSYGFGTILNNSHQVPPLPSKPLQQLGTAGPTAPVLQSTRTYNLMGQVTQVDQYEPITFTNGGIADFHADLATSTFSSYDANGHLSVETTIDKLHPENESQTIFNFDIAGILRTSEFRFGPNNGIGGTPQNFTDTYQYFYTFVAGGYKENLVTVSSTRPQAVTGTTTSRYDARGDLMTQSLDNQADDKRERRLFSYDADGHVVTKDVIFTNKSETKVLTAGGSQDFIYSNGHQIGTIGAGSLSSTTQFSNDFTPVSSTYPLAQPSSHAVVTGDTLAGIAQAYLGDANLWYLIADANGVNAGPTQALPPGEIGRVYRIPNVVDSLRNNASTSRPYNPAAIAGSSAPVPGLLPPPGESTCKQIAGAVSLAVTLIVSAVGTYVLTPFIGPVAAGAIAGGAGNALGQLTYIAMGGKPIGDFSGWDVLEATAEGAVGGAFTGVTKGVTAGASIYTQVAAQGISAGAGAVANAGIHEFFNRVRGRDDEWNLTWEGLAEDVGVGGAGALLSPVFDRLNGERLKIGSGVQQFLTSSLRPSGWVWEEESRQWSSLVNAALSAATDVAVGGVFASQDQSAREDMAGQIADIVTESPYEDPSAGVARYSVDDLPNDPMPDWLAEADQEETQQALADIEQEQQDALNSILPGILDKHPAGGRANTSNEFQAPFVPSRAVQGPKEDPAARAERLIKEFGEKMDRLGLKTAEERATYIAKTIVIADPDFLSMLRRLVPELQNQYDWGHFDYEGGELQAKQVALSGRPEHRRGDIDSDEMALNKQGAYFMGAVQGNKENLELLAKRAANPVNANGARIDAYSGPMISGKYYPDWHEEAAPYLQTAMAIGFCSANPVACLEVAVASKGAELLALNLGASPEVASLVGFGTGFAISMGGLKLPRLSNGPRGAVLEYEGAPKVLSKEAVITDAGRWRPVVQYEGSAPVVIPQTFAEVFNAATGAKVEIDAIAAEVSTQYGGRVALAPIKGADRAMQKIITDYKGADDIGVPMRIKDLARNTIVVPDDQISSVAADLASRGAQVKIIDSSNNPLGYSGVNTTFETRAGIMGEIQVNSPEMIYAKEAPGVARGILGDTVYDNLRSKPGMPEAGLGHAYYEQWRVLDPTSSTAAEIAARSRAYHDAVRRAAHGH